MKDQCTFEHQGVRQLKTQIWTSLGNWLNPHRSWMRPGLTSACKNIMDQIKFLFIFASWPGEVRETCPTGIDLGGVMGASALTTLQGSGFEWVKDSERAKENPDSCFLCFYIALLRDSILINWLVMSTSQNAPVAARNATSAKLLCQGSPSKRLFGFVSACTAQKKFHKKTWKRNLEIHSGKSSIHTISLKTRFTNMRKI